MKRVRPDRQRQLEDGWEDAVITEIVDKPRRKRGPKEYAVWPAMFAYLESVVADTGKKFSNYSAAARTGHTWALTPRRGAVPSVDTIREKIAEQRPDLVADN